MMRLSRLKSIPKKQLVLIGFPLLLILGWLSVYLGSAWWQAYQFKKLLLSGNQVKIEKQIPGRLLQASKAESLDQDVPVKGLGTRYLEHVWPHVVKHQDVYKLMILQADANRYHWTHGHFSHFPNTFRLNWGNNEHLMWFEWKRNGWHEWRLNKLCVYNPQPLSTENNCESSSR